MAIIYSYPETIELLPTDMLIGTSTIKVAGKRKNITKNFTLDLLKTFILNGQTGVQWGDITGDINNQTDLQNVLSGKQNNITLTTIGTSGPATLSGATLNIPNYAGVTYAFTSPLVNTAGVVTINQSSATTDGYLSSADWGIFNSKQNALSGTGFVKISGTTISYDNTTYYPYPTGTTSQYVRGDGSLATFPTTSTPTLNQVLTAGNVSLLDAKIGELYLYDSANTAYSKIAFEDAEFNAYDYLNARIFTVSGSQSYLRFQNNTNKLATFSSTLLTNNRIYTLPDATGTIALTSDIPSLAGYVPTSRTLTINGTTYDLTANRSWSVGTVTSVGLSMPSAFTVSSSPVTGSGTIAVIGAGVSSQYVRGDGTLANFPTSTGGGASVSYYLNGSVSQGTIGGVAYKEMNSVPVIGTGTDFSINADGYIAQFITDVGDPNKLLIPGGNWNFETYFSASSGGGTPRFYIELYKYDGTTFTLIASNSATPENITGGTSIDLYFTALAVPPTTLTVTDRLAVRFYVIHSGRTITMHTENSHLSQVITTFSSGLTALNGLTSQVQYFAVGTSGTDFNISSATDTHTFNLPTASATNRGALSSSDWSAFNSKFTLPSLTSGSVLFSNGITIAQDNANFFWDNTNKRLKLGDGSFSVDDSILLINRNLTTGGTALGFHAVRDETSYNTNATTGLRAYASFDAIVVMQGSAHFNHLHSFQSRPNFSGSNIVDAVRGLTHQATLNGNVDLHQMVFVDDYLGTGTVNQNVGLYIKPLTKGVNNFAIFAEGTTPSYLGGNITSGGILDGANLKITSLSGNYGQIPSLDSFGNVLGNPNLTIINGLLDLKDISQARIKASGTNLDLEALYNIRFFTSSSSGSEKAILTYDGDFGIGTSTPATKLDVNGVITATGGNSTSWNAKQNAITLTTTGSSGSSTFISNTLNVPTYTLSGLGGVPYVGATNDLDLGSNDIYANEYNFYDPSYLGYGRINLSAEEFFFQTTPTSVVARITYGSTFLTGINGSVQFVYTGLTTDRAYTFPNASGTIALTSDIPSLTGYVQTTRTISTTSPLQGGGDLSANRTLSILEANASQNGYLSSANWSTFNGKQDALTLTTTGTSGPATLVGATLNIPQYTGGGGTSPFTNLGVGTTGTIVTGVTVNTITQSILIPANTLAANNTLDVIARLTKTGSVGSGTYRMYINTTNSLAGATLIATFPTIAGGSVIITQQGTRTFFYNGTNLTNNVNATAGTNTDMTTSTTTQASIPYVSSVAYFLIFAIQLSNGADSSVMNGYRITRYA